MVRFILFSSFLYSCTASYKSYNPQTKFPKEALRADYDLMRNTIENNHPDLYSFISKPSLDSVFDKGYNTIKDSMTETEFKNLIAYALAYIKCGHTSVHWSPIAQKYFARQKLTLFPLHCKLINDTLVTIFNLHKNNKNFPRGTVIKSINGVSASKIIDSICSHISTDGNAIGFKLQSISNNFPFYYRMVFGSSKEYSVEYVLQKEIRKITITEYDPATDTIKPSTPTGTVVTKVQLKKNEINTPALKLSFDSSGYALLQLNSFGNTLKRKYIHRAFKILKESKVQHLIIDLRSNGGGKVNSSILFAKYIMPASFVFMDSVIAIRKSIYNNRYLDNKILYQLGMWLLTKKRSDRQYHFTHFEGKRYAPRSKNHFNGQVYILTGGSTFSAATLLAATCKGQKNITIIGEETGGGHYGNNGMFIPYINLPYSHLRVRLPLFKIVHDAKEEKNGKGVMPDVEVKVTVQSIAAYKDVKLVKAIEMIRNNQKTLQKN